MMTRRFHAVRRTRAAGVLLALALGSAGGVGPPVNAMGHAAQDRVLGRGGGRWLDADVPPLWNTPTMRVPQVTRPALTPDMRDRCGSLIRPALDSHDRLLATQGWMLVGARQQFGETVVFTATLDFDGMCRPLSLQGFVFQGTDFAGTLMPAPVDARTDGYPTRISLVSADEVVVEYARYGQPDPLCCPSATSVVRFQLRRTGDGVVAQPGPPITTSNRRP